MCQGAAAATGASPIAAAAAAITSGGKYRILIHVLLDEAAFNPCGLDRRNPKLNVQFH